MERLRRFMAAGVLAGAFYGCSKAPPQDTAGDSGFSVTTLCAEEHQLNNHLALGPHIDMIIDAQKMLLQGELWVFVKESPGDRSSTVFLKDSQIPVKIHSYFPYPFLLIIKDKSYILEAFQHPDRLLATATVKPFC